MEGVAFERRRVDLLTCETMQTLSAEKNNGLLALSLIDHFLVLFHSKKTPASPTLELFPSNWVIC